MDAFNSIKMWRWIGRKQIPQAEPGELIVARKAKVQTIGLSETPMEKQVVM